MFDARPDGMHRSHRSRRRRHCYFGLVISQFPASVQVMLFADRLEVVCQRRLCSLAGRSTRALWGMQILLQFDILLAYGITTQRALPCLFNEIGQVCVEVF